MLCELPDSSVDAICTDPPYALAFRGADWDSMHPDPRVWRHCLRVLRPGAYLLSFGGCRTWHRLCCDIEDAGFLITDSVAWLHSQGLPKTSGALKPSHEPIVVARKKGPRIPLGIDACRTAAGRWPANVALDDQIAALLDEDTAHLKAGGSIAPGSKGAGPRRNNVYATETKDRGPWSPYGDAGGASRFFPVFRYQAKAPACERPTVNGVRHNTVKPLELMRWLVRLVVAPPLEMTPLENDVVVLDPFAGTGTTIEACLYEGVQCIAVEREADYLPLIMARLGIA